MKYVRYVKTKKILHTNKKKPSIEGFSFYDSELKARSKNS